MKMLRWGLLALVIAVAGLSQSSPRAEAADSHYGCRQYYGNWKHHTQQKYWYRSYYYKPQPKYSGWKHHYVMHYPQKPKHYYYYNPYKKQYWGRCAVDTDGRDLYSMLAEVDRKPTMDEIAEDKFPQPSAAPPIPDSSDNVSLDLPPDDLPPASAEPDQGLPR